MTVAKKIPCGFVCVCVCFNIFKLECPETQTHLIRTQMLLLQSIAYQSWTRRSWQPKKRKLLRRTKSGSECGSQKQEAGAEKTAVLLDTFLMEELAESWWDPGKIDASRPTDRCVLKTGTPEDIWEREREEKETRARKTWDIKDKPRKRRQECLSTLSYTEQPMLMLMNLEIKIKWK